MLLASFWGDSALLTTLKGIVTNVVSFLKGEHVNCGDDYREAMQHNEAKFRCAERFSASLGDRGKSLKGGRKSLKDGF